MKDTMLDKTKVNLAEVMRGFATTVSIISTSGHKGGHYAMTATAVSSVSLDPESMLVCINKDTLFNSILEELDKFCINLLASGQSSQSIDCAGRLPQDNRVKDTEWEILDDGMAVLKDAQAYVFCRKVKTLEHGSHNIIIGDVYKIILNKAAEPLLYMDGKYGRFNEI